MDLLSTLPLEMWTSIFESLSNFPCYQSVRLDILNAMLSCKLFYSIGLPFLYKDVKLNRTYTKAKVTLAFCASLPHCGHFVRRLRITEEHRGPKPEGYVPPSALLRAVAGYCPQLRVLYLQYTPDTLRPCHEETLRGVRDLVHQCQNLEILVLPPSFIENADFAPLLPQLKSLRQFRCRRETRLSGNLLRSIAVQCPDITEIHLSEIWTLSYQDLLECLKFLPNLEALQLHHVRELYRKEPGDQRTAGVLCLRRILETLSSHNRFLHTLVLEYVGSTEYLPSITPSWFPCLRYFSLRSGEYWQSSCLPEEYQPSPCLVNFLVNLSSLRIVQLDSRNVIFSDGTLMAFHLPAKVKVRICYPLPFSSRCETFRTALEDGRIEKVNQESPKLYFEADDFLLHSK
jgi:hypothetical protein